MVSSQLHEAPMRLWAGGCSQSEPEFGWSCRRSDQWERGSRCREQNLEHLSSHNIPSGKGYQHTQLNNSTEWLTIKLWNPDLHLWLVLVAWLADCQSPQPVVVRGNPGALQGWKRHKSGGDCSGHPPTTREQRTDQPSSLARTWLFTSWPVGFHLARALPSKLHRETWGVKARRMMEEYINSQNKCLGKSYNTFRSVISLSSVWKLKYRKEKSRSLCLYIILNIILSKFKNSKRLRLPCFSLSFVKSFTNILPRIILLIITLDCLNLFSNFLEKISPQYLYKARQKY